VFWPDLGFTPWKTSQAYVMTLSHWSGPLAVLDVHSDWIYDGRYHQLFGSFSYDGKPVFGYETTQFGAPVDSFGRLIYIDTFSAPAYGAAGAARTASSRRQGRAGSATASSRSTRSTAATRTRPPGRASGDRASQVDTASRAKARA
jgi:hypothetical protein